MTKKPRIDNLTLMRLLGTVYRRTRDQDLTTTRILKLAHMKSLHTVYAYVRYACENGLMRVQTVKDPRPLGFAKYYFLTPAGHKMLQAWMQAHRSGSRGSP
jgi:DNA-binding PadR family transcriptional regulator